MDTYITNFWLAVLAFVFLFIASIIPFIYWNYKKYGHIGGARTIGIYLLVFFFLAALIMVIFPLPEITHDFCAKRAGKLDPNFEFFRFIKEIIEDIDGKVTLIKVLKSQAFMVTIFNVFLLMPVGFLLRYLFNLKWWKVLIIAFLTSLFLEVTQLTGNYGIYPCAYRLFEVDDLMTNTFGAMLGYWLFSYFGFLPSSEIKKVELKKEANLTQRFLMFVFDYLFISFIAEVFIIPEDIGILSRMVWTLIIFFIYFVVIPLTRFNSSFAGKFFGLKLVKERNNESADLKSLSVFYGILIFFPLVTSSLFKYLVETQENNGIYAITNFIILLFWFISVFGLALFNKNKKGLHNILSGLKLVSIR